MMNKLYNGENKMDSAYRLILEWDCNGILMATVKTPGGYSVMGKTEWCKLFGRLHPELWKNGEK